MAIATTTIVAGLTAAAGAASVAGSVQQARAAKKTSEFNAELAERNSAIHTQNANQTLLETGIEVDKIRRQAKRIQGVNKANALKAGTTISGSVADILLDSSYTQEEEALATRYKGMRDAAQSKFNASESLLEARIKRSQGRSAFKTGLLAASGQFLGTASSVGKILGTSDGET